MDMTVVSRGHQVAPCEEDCWVASRLVIAGNRTLDYGPFRDFDDWNYYMIIRSLMQAGF